MTSPALSRPLCGLLPVALAAVAWLDGRLALCLKSGLGEREFDLVRENRSFFLKLGYAWRL